MTATVNGSVITLTSNATGSSSDYMVYVSNLNESGPGGTALAGGAAGVPTYDTGTVTASINGATASYTWGSTDTGVTVASGLKAAISQADSGFLGATLSGTTLNLASTQTGSSTNWPVNCTVTDSNSTLFPTASFAEACNGMTGGTDPVSGGTQAVYNYALGYYSNSNVQTVSDAVMGNWAYTYDSLNRVLTGQASANPQTGFAPYGTGLLSWSYDSFGNYEGQKLTGNTTAIVNQGTYLYTGHSLLNSAIGTGTPTNQIDDDCYDASGNLIGVGGGCSTYTYDAEGRLASVVTTSTQYVYDAEGRRVAKLNGTTLTKQYLLGLGGEQVSELDGSGNWLHSNVYAAGRLLATYNNGGLHFHFSDWLGTRRVQSLVQTSSAETVEETCQSLPYGDSLNCAGSADVTEQHFTGKERDAESGLDNFDARYFGSTMGRFMSPDPSGLLAAKPQNPQSWNLYAYAMNNPLVLVDPTGLDCVYANDPGTAVEIIDHNSDSTECGENGGSWVTGYVNEAWAHFNDTAKAFEVAAEDGGQVNFAQFQAGALTNDAGNCLSGCDSYGFSSTSADFLTGKLVGNSRPTDGSDPLDGLLTFMTERNQPVTDFWKWVAGPINGKDDWAGPGGMGPPLGTGDWRAAVHDYNFHTNGIGIGSYFNTTLSPATSRALIQSNNNLMRTGGVQGAKEKMVFGVINAFQWYAGSWK